MPSSRGGHSSQDLFVNKKLSAELWVHEVLNRQHLVESFFIHQPLLQHQVAHAAACFKRFLGDKVTVVVSDEWVEVGDNTNGVNHVIAAHICVRGNADDALLAQGIYGIAHDADGLE